MENTNPWGYHLALDCASGEISAITSTEIIKNFVDELVKDIDMVKYGDILIDHFATHDPNKAGISFCQMIETSNITGHFVDLNGDFYIDCFSCKPYNYDTVYALVKKYFNPKSIRIHIFDRKA